MSNDETVAQVREAPAGEVQEREPSEPNAKMSADDLAEGMQKAFEEQEAAGEQSLATEEPEQPAVEQREEVAAPTPDEVEQAAPSGDQDGVADLIAHPDDNDHSLLAKVQRLANEKIRDQAYEGQQYKQREEAAKKQAEYWRSKHAGLRGFLKQQGMAVEDIPEPPAPTAALEDDGFDPFADQPSAASARLDDGAEPGQPVRQSGHQQSAPDGDGFASAQVTEEVVAGIMSAGNQYANELSTPEGQQLVQQQAAKLKTIADSASSGIEAETAASLLFERMVRQLHQVTAERRTADQAASLRSKKRVAAAAATSGPSAAPRRRPVDPASMPLSDLRKALDAMSNK